MEGVKAHLMFDGIYSEHFLFFPFSVKDMCKAKRFVYVGGQANLYIDR